MIQSPIKKMWPWRNKKILISLQINVLVTVHQEQICLNCYCQLDHSTFNLFKVDVSFTKKQNQSLFVLEGKNDFKWINLSLKLVSAIFYQIFIVSPNDSPLKTMENVSYFI